MANRFREEGKHPALVFCVKEAGGVIALAKLLNNSPQTIQTWFQRGKIPPDKAIKLNRLFKIELDQLLEAHPK